MLAYAIWNILNQTRQKLGAERFASAKFERAAVAAHILIYRGIPHEFLTTAAYAEFV